MNLIRKRIIFVYKKNFVYNIINNFNKNGESFLKQNEKILNKTK